MIGRYKQVAIDAAAGGMVLADAVCDAQGNVLLAGGTALSDATLAALRRRGVASVRIQDDGLPPAELEAERERVAERLAHLFRTPDPGPADTFLREQIASYRLEQLQ